MSTERFIDDWLRLQMDGDYIPLGEKAQDLLDRFTPPRIGELLIVMHPRLTGLVTMNRLIENMRQSGRPVTLISEDEFNLWPKKQDDLSSKCLESMMTLKALDRPRLTVGGPDKMKPAERSRAKQKGPKHKGW